MITDKTLSKRVVDYVTGQVDAALSAWAVGVREGSPDPDDALEVLALWAHLDRFDEGPQIAEARTKMSGCIGSDWQKMAKLLPHAFDAEAWKAGFDRLRVLTDNVRTEEDLAELNESARCLFIEGDQAELAAMAVGQMLGARLYPDCSDLDVTRWGDLAPWADSVRECCQTIEGSGRFFEPVYTLCKAMLHGYRRKYDPLSDLAEGILKYEMVVGEAEWWGELSGPCEAEAADALPGPRLLRRPSAPFIHMELVRPYEPLAAAADAQAFPKGQTLRLQFVAGDRSWTAAVTIQAATPENEKIVFDVYEGDYRMVSGGELEVFDLTSPIKNGKATFDAAQFKRDWDREKGLRHLFMTRPDGSQSCAYIKE